MTTLLFPDNTVLVNFALVQRIDLFEALAAGRGAWTVTIAEECAKSARRPELEALERIPEILGAPWVPTRAERVDTFAVRIKLAAPGDPQTRHLGEAEAIAMLGARDAPAVFVTDDGAASTLAETFGLRCLTTSDLFKLAVRARLIDADTCWDLLRNLFGEQRGLPGAPRTRAAFDVWIVA